jgi:hypothetical protein
MTESTFYHDVVVATVQPNCRAVFLLCEEGIKEDQPSFAIYQVIALLQVNRRVYHDGSGSTRQPNEGKCFTLHVGPIPQLTREEQPELEDVHDMTICMVVSDEDGEVVLAPSSGYEVETLSSAENAFGRLVLCPWPEAEDEKRLDGIKTELAKHIKARATAKKERKPESKKSKA